MKKAIAILCLTALFLSTSSISYFYWVEEKLHEQEVFAKIKANNFDQIKSEGKEPATIIQLVVKNKKILPEGYHWEEEGREFSYQGMFYDIVSLKRTSKGWEIMASSDQEEAAIVANKNKSSSTEHRLKLTRVQFVYLKPDNSQQDLVIVSNELQYLPYKLSLHNRSLMIISPPPEAI